MTGAPAEKKLILVVEDDPDALNLLYAILETLGYDYIGFSNGRDALAGIGGKPIDVAILDIMMPEMDGYQLMAEMRKLPEFESTPVIMTTAKDKDSEILDGYKHGADYYITKPYSSKQIEYGLKMFV
jgi:DNA-binding response OmpR family regulator